MLVITCGCKALFIGDATEKSAYSNKVIQQAKIVGHSAGSDITDIEVFDIGADITDIEVFVVDIEEGGAGAGAGKM